MHAASGLFDTHGNVVADMSTVDDFREEGPVAVMRDAALDTADIAAGAASWIAGFQDDRPVLYCDRKLTVGEVYPLELSDGRVVDAMTLEVDTISTPFRARVLCPEVTDGALDPPLA